MRYAIVMTERAEAKGMNAKWHKVNNVGTKMAINENELLKVDTDTAKAAEALGGVLMSLDELKRAMAVWDE